MDKRTPHPARLEERAVRSSMPASPPEENTLVAQAQTQDSVQPPRDYFHTGERTMSPPPVALEKARVPSPGPYPDTPAASTFSGFSRSSTINSSQSRDSEITLYSQATSTSDDTISVPRSLSFPVMGFSPLNRDSVPNAAHIRVLRLLQQTAVPVSMNWSRPSLDESHPSGPEEGSEEIPAPYNQALPSRHSTFPIGRPRNPANVDNTYPPMPRGIENPTDPDASAMDDQPPEVAAAVVPEMRHDVTNQELPSDEAYLPSLPVQTDMFLQGRFSAKDGWLVGSIDRKRTGFHGGFVSSSSTESFLHYRRRLSRYKKNKGTERIMDVPIRHYNEDRERPSSRNGHRSSTADPLFTREAVAAPESPKRAKLQSQADDMEESLSSCSSPRMKPSAEDYHEPCPTDLHDVAHSPDGSPSPASEVDEEFAYDELLKKITSLIYESSCVGNVEERGVPVKLYVHSLLEQILNHQKPTAEGQILCFPIRTLPKGNTEVPHDAGEPNTGTRGQAGQGGTGGKNKRKNDDLPDHGHFRGQGDDDHSYDSSEDDEDSNPQQAKKQKTDKKNRNYSCPFRKRNPVRFNVRDNYSCACNSFADFALLKRHIKYTHQKASGLFSCLRCKTSFTSQTALEDHSTQLEGCQLIMSTGNEDPEDGISAEVGRALQVRTKNANIRSWTKLWTHLFPRDKLEDIPDPDHEPPVELEEILDYCYREEVILDFVQTQPFGDFLSEQMHGFRFLAESSRRCRRTSSGKYPKKRRDRDQRFDVTVRNALLTRAQFAYATQQPHPPPGFAQTQWVPEMNNTMPFGNGLDVFSDDSYPSYPAYGTHLGFDGGSHIPAAGAIYPSSEGGAQPAPQGPSEPMNFQYLSMQNGRPSLTAEGSGHRSSAQFSSGLSSQPSRDSGDLRTQPTLETLETQDTQFTQYTTQTQQDPASLSSQQTLHADDGKTGDHGGTCSCSASPVGMPGGQHSCPDIPGQGSFDPSLNYVGSGPSECVLGSNSDEESLNLP